MKRCQHTCDKRILKMIMSSDFAATFVKGGDSETSLGEWLSSDKWTINRDILSTVIRCTPKDLERSLKDILHCKKRNKI